MWRDIGRKDSCFILGTSAGLQMVCRAMLAWLAVPIIYLLD